MASLVVGLKQRLNIFFFLVSTRCHKQKTMVKLKQNYHIFIMLIFPKSHFCYKINLIHKLKKITANYLLNCCVKLYIISKQTLFKNLRQTLSY